MIVMKIIAFVFFFIGAFFIFVGTLGIVRMPDVYNKLQAGTKATTMGFLSVCVGLIFWEPSWILRALVIAGFVVLTNPIGSHALARAAKNSGIPFAGGKDKLQPDQDIISKGSVVNHGLAKDSAKNADTGTDPRAVRGGKK
ncbi:MAG: hypothetical protein A2014_12325 [Spirochaetes bacterium GWF1_49_6]|nr:MAG: hypothetical protein A2014_12325 [Spirochaetes bacterium GWF1_49_6]